RVRRNRRARTLLGAHRGPRLPHDGQPVRPRRVRPAHARHRARRRHRRRARRVPVRPGPLAGPPARRRRPVGGRMGSLPPAVHRVAMGFDVYLEHPAYLWILVAALPLLAFAALRSYAIAPRWKRITSFVLRTLALALVVLAITRPVWRLAKPDQSVAFAIDVSDSVDRDALHAALEHVVAATRDLAEPRSAALVLFAGRPKVVRPLAPEPIALTPPADDALGIEQMVMHRFVKEESEAEILAIERHLTGDDAEARLVRARARLARRRAS